MYVFADMNQCICGLKLVPFAEETNHWLCVCLVKLHVHACTCSYRARHGHSYWQRTDELTQLAIGPVISTKTFRTHLAVLRVSTHCTLMMHLTVEVM